MIGGTTSSDRNSLIKQLIKTNPYEKMKEKHWKECCNKKGKRKKKKEEKEKRKRKRNMDRGDL